MLLLILAHGHVGGAIDEDIGSHEIWINIKAHRGRLAVLAGLFFELGHPIEPAQPRHAVEYPGKLGVLRHLALVENNVLCGIYSGGEEGGGNLARIALQFTGVLPNGNCVQVDHAIDAIVRVLHLDEPPDCAEIIAEVEIARRLNARKYARTTVSHRTILLWRGYMPAKSFGAKGRSLAAKHGAKLADPHGARDV